MNKYIVFKLVECQGCDGRGGIFMRHSCQFLTCGKCKGKGTVKEEVPFMEVVSEYMRTMKPEQYHWMKRETK